MIFKNILKNTGYLYIGQIIGKCFYLVLIVFISRHLGVVGIGQYASSFAFVGMFFVFVNAGLDGLQIKEIAAHKERAGGDLLNFILLRFLFCLSIFLIILYAANKIEAFEDIKKYIVILTISSFIGSFAQAFCSILVAYEKMKDIMRILIIKDVTIVSLSIIALLSGGSLLHVVICFLIGAIIGFIFSAVSIWKLNIRPTANVDFSEIGIFLKKSLPFLTGTLFLFMLFRIDITMLKLLQGNRAVGIYRVAYSFLMNLEIFPIFFMLTLYPKFSRLFKKDKAMLIKLYKRSFTYLLWINTLMLITVFVFGKMFILLIFGEKFMESAIILQYAVFAVFFLFQNTANRYFFNAVDKPGFNTLILGLGILINFSLNLFLIPRYSYYGVLLSIFVSYLFIFISSAYIINRKLLKAYARMAV